MQDEEREKKWEELLLSLRKVQSGLPPMLGRGLTREPELDRVITQMRKMIMVVHKLFEELKKQIEEK